jgi:hypothetical protein
LSTYADSSQAVVWIDGDAFRGPANGTQPTNPFASAPLSGATSLLAFGAIKAGFAITPDQEIKKYDVWNNESGAAFMTVEGNTTTTIKFRASQLSKATVMTALRGGSIAETSAGSGIWKHTDGSGEEFSLLLQLKGADGVKKEADWIPRCKLAKKPEKVKNDDDLDGYEFEIEVLAPAAGGQAVVPFTNWNPLA